MDEPQPWMVIVADKPDHSRWYIERFRAMAAAGSPVAHGVEQDLDAGGLATYLEPAHQH